MTIFTRKAFAIAIIAVSGLGLTVGTASAGLEALNAIHPNSLSSNALHPNALTVNALHPNALHPNALTVNAIETTNAIVPIGFESTNTATASRLPTASPATLRLSFGGADGARVTEIELPR